MNKFNLVNMITWNKAKRRGSMFQQQFQAKSETRAFHGPHLTETQWRNIFKGELNGVNPLRSTKEAVDEQQRETPWALQTYLPTERRLDTAIFRSFFASSTRQAHQLIVKGKVKVNGIKIRSPGYELKPGDLFSVDPEAVLYAMGRKKPSIQESVDLTNRQIVKYNNYVKRAKKHPLKYFRLKQHQRSKHKVFNALYIRKQKKKIEEHNKQIGEEMRKELDSVTPGSVFKTIVKNEPFFDKYGTLPLTKNSQLLNKALSVFALATGKRGDSKATNGATKEQIKNFKQEAPSDKVNELHTQYYGKDIKNPPGNKGDVKKLVQELIKIKQEQVRVDYTSKLKDSKSPHAKYNKNWTKALPSEPLEKIDPEQAKEDPSQVKVPLPFSNGKLYGLADSSKQYFTPWNPRAFISPFAVLPHHIEISFKTCHAVYLRDPVARPGHSEIISPFNLDMHERAYMFYIRKRRKNL